ncbi:MAG: YdeI/OmpD-associated family protein [Devosia nanyangense]|uniref:YdeI/OmpD-associated family protein n=1 Tax=Devosia nanyangense TaxID=1228055 RepID=A0A933NXR3_9HYPH|nr:YdeI/OmpD-associated family protein [Devosia nanyangense]
MAPFVVNPEAVHEFKDLKSLEKWYARNHAKATEFWIKLHKKGSGLASVTNVEALDAALCWGWIDGIRKSFDDRSFLQRYTPRTKTSIWSQVNIAHIERLRKAGRMQPAGQAQVELAKADGRWAKAYGGFSGEQFPADLLAAIEAEPKALELFQSLNAQNRFALGFRTHQTKTAAGRAKKIANFVEMLKRGETIHPNGKAK